jgi:hypothetical protein
MFAERGSSGTFLQFSGHTGRHDINRPHVLPRA